MSLPSKVILPLKTFVNPKIVLSSVDFPEPLGPTIAVIASRW